MRSAVGSPPPVAPEDWRVLRTLSVYRLTLVLLLIALYAFGYAPNFLEHLDAGEFLGLCIGYGMVALALIPATFLRRPGLRIQAHTGFVIDALGLVALVYAAKGISSGFGVLLITPAVGSSLILSRRMSLLHAALATVLLLIEEFLRQSPAGFDSAASTETGLLGMILFGTVIAANAVAGRARKSEALAVRVGTDLANLSQLNERIIESMETGVLVVDEARHIRLLNAAARRLLDVVSLSASAALAGLNPELAQALQRWEENPGLGNEPIALWRGGRQVIPRFTSLGNQLHSPVLIQLDDAAQVSVQAQQIKLAALGRLSASIAHEIRNPLSAIHHAGQLLAESPQIDAQDRRLLDMIRRHSVRIDKIVQDVMGLSRRDVATPAVIDLREFIQRTLATYQEAHPDHTRPIDFADVPTGLPIRFDPNHLQQVLLNLWDNSFAHGGAQVRVDLQVRRQASSARVLLEISDDGDGIPPPLQDKIFEPFFTTAHGGTGLGLYLARELCDYNRSRLDYVPGRKGACFRLSFAT